VKSNDRTWVVSAKDALDADGHLTPKTDAGKMLQYNSTAPSTWGAIALGSALDVGATNSGHLIGSEVAALSGADQTIANGDGNPGGAGTFSLVPLTIKQAVTYSDPVLAPDVYRIIVTLTGTTP